MRLATEPAEDLACSLVVSAIGFRGRAVPGLPYDDAAGHIPHHAGRVDDGAPTPGTYVVGWAKRGPSGTIGTNKLCAQETVASLLEDAAAGRLPAVDADAADLTGELPGRVALDGWRRLDRHERDAGRQAGRPRVKAVRLDDMLTAARG